jgi:hypothetical protein
MKNAPLTPFGKWYMKKKKKFNPQKTANKIEYHAVKQGNGLWKVQRLTIRANKSFTTHTLPDCKNLTEEQANHIQLLKSRGH